MERSWFVWKESEAQKWIRIWSPERKVSKWEPDENPRKNKLAVLLNRWLVNNLLSSTSAQGTLSQEDYYISMSGINQLCRLNTLPPTNFPVPCHCTSFSNGMMVSKFNYSVACWMHSGTFWAEQTTSVGIPSRRLMSSILDPHVLRGQLGCFPGTGNSLELWGCRLKIVADQDRKQANKLTQSPSPTYKPNSSFQLLLSQVDWTKLSMMHMYLIWTSWPDMLECPCDHPDNTCQLPDVNVAKITLYMQHSSRLVCKTAAVCDAFTIFQEMCLGGFVYLLGGGGKSYGL